MKLTSINPFTVIASFNIFIISAIYFDYYNPRVYKTIEKFESFETNAVIIRSRTSSSYGINNYVNCQNGNSYFLTRLPKFEDKFEKGENFTIIKTLFLNKTKGISIKKGPVLYFEDLSFLNYNINKILFLIALFISIVYFFFKKDFILFFLAIALVYTVVFSFLYII